MKSLLITIIFSTFFFILPNSTYAFTEAPVAVIVLDNYGKFNEELNLLFNDRMKRRFRFPDYKVLPVSKINSFLQHSGIPTPSNKRPYFQKEQLQILAEQIPADIVCMVSFTEFKDDIVSSGLFVFSGEQIRISKLKMDINNISKINWLLPAQTNKLLTIRTCCY